MIAGRSDSQIAKPRRYDQSRNCTVGILHGKTINDHERLICCDVIVVYDSSVDRKVTLQSELLPLR